MRFDLLSAIVIGLLNGPVQAQTAQLQSFVAQNGVEVLPLTNGFSVANDPEMGARGIWCAAADYARRGAGAMSAQRLFVAQDRGTGLGQRGAVAFTLDPTGLTPSSVIILGPSLARAGANLSVGHAFGFCADRRTVTDTSF